MCDAGVNFDPDAKSTQSAIIALISVTFSFEIYFSHLQRVENRKSRKLHANFDPITFYRVPRTKLP